MAGILLRSEPLPPSQTMQANMYGHSWRTDMSVLRADTRVTHFCTQKQASVSNVLYVRASGPWITISYSGSLLTPEGLVVYNQQLYESNSGIAKVLRHPPY